MQTQLLFFKGKHATGSFEVKHILNQLNVSKYWTQYTKAFATNNIVDDFIRINYQ